MIRPFEAALDYIGRSYSYTKVYAAGAVALYAVYGVTELVNAPEVISDATLGYAEGCTILAGVAGIVEGVQRRRSHGSE